MASESRVAPLKLLSITRLELQGGLQAARLGKSLEDELKLELSRKVFWTDSEIVLRYLRNGAKQFNFVNDSRSVLLKILE